MKLTATIFVVFALLAFVGAAADKEEERIDDKIEDEIEDDIEDEIEDEIEEGKEEEEEGENIIDVIHASADIDEGEELDPPDLRESNLCDEIDCDKEDEEPEEIEVKKRKRKLHYLVRENPELDNARYPEYAKELAEIDDLLEQFYD